MQKWHIHIKYAEMRLNTHKKKNAHTLCLSLSILWPILWLQRICSRRGQPIGLYGPDYICDSACCPVIPFPPKHCINRDPTGIKASGGTNTLPFDMWWHVYVCMYTVSVSVCKIYGKHCLCIPCTFSGSTGMTHALWALMWIRSMWYDCFQTQ